MIAQELDDEAAADFARGAAAVRNGAAAWQPPQSPPAYIYVQPQGTIRCRETMTSGYTGTRTFNCY
jgi:hypothetical protein